MGTRGPSRRTLIKTGLATATSAALAFSTKGAAAAPSARQNPFTLGVASGDPWPTSVVLWTRLALNPLADDGRGGMPARDYELLWQVAKDPTFRSVVKSGRAMARPEFAHAVHVEATGLEPGREYWYRFRQGSHLSEPALTRTAPARGETPASLGMSFVSCSQYEHGWFTAYQRLAEDQPELILHLGDYQYEYKAGAYVAPGGNVRDHAGPETTDLATYRQRHAQYKSDPDLQAAHAIAPWLVIWDDHEADNNWADEMPEKPAEAGPAFLERRAAAFRAYYENMPLRPSSAPQGIDLQLYRRIHWGELATFHMLDTRQYRDDQGCGDGYRTDCPEAVDPSRTITGDDQEAWLLDGFRQSKARWDILGQQVFFAQRDNNVSPDIKTVSMDGWDGYQASRERITRGWVDADVRNPVVLTGDVHAHWASDVKIDYDDPAAPWSGSELVCSSITSGGDGADSATPHPWLAWNQHLKFQNNLRGYVNTTITPGQLDADFRCLPKVSVAGQPVFTRRSYRIVDGERGLQQTADHPPASVLRKNPSDDQVTRDTVAWETERP